VSDARGPGGALPPRPALAEMLRAFLWIGLASFGGGRAAYFQEALVLRRRWFPVDEFLEALALSQVLPGPVVGNLAAILGYRLRGWAGAALAVACLTLPGAILILALGSLYFHGLPTALVGPVGRGVSAASVGIAVAATVKLRGGVREVPEYAIAALVFVAFGLLHWPIHWALAAGLPPALLLAWWRQA
jgi:chromate transporter